MIRFIFDSVIVSLLAFVIGCSGEAEPVTSSGSKYEAADPDANDSQELSALQNLADTGSQTLAGDALPNGGDPTEAPSIDSMFGDSDPAPIGLAPLADDATLEDALAYFDKANDALRMLINGRTAFTTQEAVMSEAKRISGQKLAAAERALSYTAITDDALVVAKRNKLEALSQMTGLQDIKAASQLEAFANEVVSGDNAELATEGRVVLVGFELDKLRNGIEKTPDALVAQVKALTASESPLQAPAFFALQQCYSGLRQYAGYGEASREIRDEISRRFSDHADPQISGTAKQLATLARFDGLDALQQSIQAGTEVTNDKWTEELAKLVAQPDVPALQYVSNLALSAEQIGQSEVASLAYGSLKTAFADAEGAEESVVKSAKSFLDARDARAAILGQPLAIDYPDLQQTKMDWQSFRGSVVVMPFWIANQPQSLFLLMPALEQISKKYGDTVKILGVNLDATDEELNILRQRAPMPFPNIRNPDVGTRGPLDPLAAKVGFATFPFVVVVDEEGNVSRILMGMTHDLVSIVDEMVPEGAAEQPAAEEPAAQ